VKCKQSAGGSSSWAESTYKRINDCIRHIGNQLVQWGLLLSEEPENITDFIVREAERFAISLRSPFLIPLDCSSAQAPLLSSVGGSTLPSPALVNSSLSLIKLFLKCRSMIQSEKQSVGRKSYQTVSSSLSTNLQETLEPLMSRAERKSPQNQVTRHPLSLSYAHLLLA
jgi:hypothetical protein